MKNSFIRFVSRPRNWVIVFALFAVAAGTPRLFKKKTVDDSGIVYTSYNNYKIFKASHFHLKDGKDLYALHPQEHFDYYKYTPTFAAIFGLLAYMPDWLGLNLWNLLNGLLLLVAIYYLPLFNNYKKGLILLICLIECMTSMQNSQSNALMAALLVLAFGLFEKNKPQWATLCLVASAFIKLFGIVGFALCLFYPHKGKTALYSLLWFAVLLAVPLLFVDFEQYQHLWQSYGNLLTSDHDASYGYSVMGWLHTWLGWSGNKNIVVLVGAAIFLVPLCKIKNYAAAGFRLLTLASLLIWTVIFNHKAESPTFIIAIAGVAIWFIYSPKTPLNVVLFALAFIFASLSPTDIFPRIVRETLVTPYCLKGVPCIFIWCKVIYDMMVFKPTYGMIERK